MDIFENPALETHTNADTVLNAALAGVTTKLEPNSVLVGLALYDEDRVYVERWCRRIASKCNDPWLVATASLCLGHLARRFGYLEQDSVALVRLLTKRTDLDGRVLDALNDVTHYLPDE